LGRLLIRGFRLLVIVGALALVADFLRGFTGTAEARGQLFHGWFSIATVSLVVAIHLGVYVYLAVTGRRVETRVREAGLPAWLGAHAERNRRRISRLPWISVFTILLAAWLGGEAVARGPVVAAWHLGVWAFATAFNLGSLAVESTAIPGHFRLLMEVEARTKACQDRLRTME
jgi:hypothetical protein